MLCIGHRGAKGHLPENTLPSFELAVEMGCDGIELDVYAVQGELIVIHDKDLERTTNGAGKVMDQPLTYLRSLDAGNGEQIPTLREVLELIDRRCRVNVELKGPGTALPASRLLGEFCSKGWHADDFLVSSFDHAELGGADPKYPRGVLFGRLPRNLFQRAKDLGAWSVNFDRRTVTAPLIEDVHEQGYQALTYTVNEESDIRQMIDCGVDGMFSDFPDRVLAIRDHS
jgi:glycerophosphoryl diester phosphodiesterase